MANEIYDSTWWGNTIQTASSIGTSTEMIQGQFNLTKLGDELVVNGDFATDSDWNKGTGWVIENGVLRLTTTSTDNTSQAIGLVQNNIYKITFTVSDTTLGGVRIRLGIGSLTGVYTNGTHTIQLEQTTANDAFRIYSDSSGVFNGSIDNVSVKEARAEEVEAKKCLADAIHRIGIQDIQN